MLSQPKKADRHTYYPSKTKGPEWASVNCSKPPASQTLPQCNLTTHGDPKISAKELKASRSGASRACQEFQGEAMAYAEIQRARQARVWYWRYSRQVFLFLVFCVFAVLTLFLPLWVGFPLVRINRQQSPGLQLQKAKRVRQGTDGNHTSNQNRKNVMYIIIHFKKIS